MRVVDVGKATSDESTTAIKDIGGDLDKSQITSSIVNDLAAQEFSTLRRSNCPQ
jgi:hypothetical protein